MWKTYHREQDMLTHFITLNLILGKYRNVTPWKILN